jgi:trk system potassium uptake protein TrkA
LDVGLCFLPAPERAYGERLASRIFHAGIVEELPLGEDMTVTELAAPPAMVGRTLAELELPRRFDVNVVAIRRREGDRGVLVWPKPTLALEHGDILVVVGRPGTAQTMVERLG